MPPLVYLIYLIATREIQQEKSTQIEQKNGIYWANADAISPIWHHGISNPRLQNCIFATIFLQ